MDQSAIDNFIEGIKAPGALGDSVKAFHELSKEDRLALLNSLKDIKHETTGDYLNALYSDEADKDVQKQIRKTLFVLKTRGIRVEEPRKTGDPVALKKVEEVRAHRALLSNYDSQNTRLLVIFYEMKRNSFIFINAATHFPTGLLEMMSAPVDQAGMENIAKGYLGDRRPDMALVDISPKYANYLLEEASARSGRYKEETRQWKQYTSGIKDTVGKPGDIYGLPIPDTTRELPIEKILAHSIFQPFSLTWNTMEEDRKEYNGIGSSSIVLPPYMVQEKRQAFIQRLLESDELKAKIPLIKRLYEDYAYIFHCLKEFTYYKGLIDYILDIKDPGHMLLFFINNALITKEEKQPGLIVGPYG